MTETAKIPTQKTLNYNFERIPVEYIRWGTNPDHFKIDMPHRHEFDELLFFVKGGGLHEIDFIEHEILDYSVHFIPAKTVHFLNRDIKSTGFTIAFNKIFLQNHSKYHFQSPLPIKPTIFNLDALEFSNITSIVDLLVKQIGKSKSPFVEKCFVTSIELILNELMTNFKGDNELKSKQCELIDSFLQFLDIHIHESRLVSFYASKLHISPKHLANMSKLHLNKSAKTIINESFIRMIKRDLSNESANLKNIADKYNMDESALCKYFKKNVGYTIEAYKSQINVEY